MGKEGWRYPGKRNSLDIGNTAVFFIIDGEYGIKYISTTL